MTYSPIRPSFLGLRTYKNINKRSIIDYIDWIYFFNAWRITGDYKKLITICNCEACKTKWIFDPQNKNKDKAKEAFELFMNAKEVLNTLLYDKNIKINASIYFSEAKSNSDEIIFMKDNNISLKIPMLRQQTEGERNVCLSLADFISPIKDYIGLFCICVSGTESLIAHYREKGDEYTAILIQSVSDRLAEATSEWLHLQVRKRIWGYAENENLTLEDIFKCKYSGIRPAIGYPSLPDQSIIFEIDKLLHLNEAGIKITENGAMYPCSSICGLYISHPKSSYFMINKIGLDQLKSYSNQRGKTEEEMKHYIGRLCD